MSIVRATIAIRLVHQLGALGTGTSLMDQSTELDSHANTSVVGKESALLIHDYETPVHVHGYTEEVGRSSNAASSALLMTTQRWGTCICL